MKITLHWPGVTKHLIALALGWGGFSVLLGLFYAFDVIEASGDVTPTLAIPYFLKVTAITFLIGSIVLSLPIIIWKSLSKKNALNKE